jgi:hypothetical protein
MVTASFHIVKPVAAHTPTNFIESSTFVIVMPMAAKFAAHTGQLTYIAKNELRNMRLT